MLLKLIFPKIWLSLFSFLFSYLSALLLFYNFKSSNFGIPYAEIAQNSLIFSGKKKSKLILAAYKYA